MTETDLPAPATFPGRLIVDKADDPYWNMAVDEALMDECSRAGSLYPVLRFYEWSIPSVSIGYFQSASKILADLKSGKKYFLVRRPTGGGAVVHDKDVTFSLIFPEKLLTGAVIDSYRLINESIVRSIAGSQAVILYDDTVATGKQGAPKFCFNEPTRYDIIWKSLKIGGSAQRRRMGYVLHQSSFFYTKCAELFCSAGGENDIRRLVRRSIARAVESLFGVTLREDNLTENETACAHKLRESRYSTEEWNFFR